MSVPIKPIVEATLTPEQRDKLIEYRRLVSTGVDPATAKARVRAMVHSSFAQKAVRQAGVAIRGAGQGLAAMAAGVAPLLLNSPMAGNPNDPISQGITKAGDAALSPLPEAATGGERMLQAGSAGLAGGMGGAGAVGALPGVAAGLSGQGTAEMGGGPIAQFLASLVGGGVAAGGQALVAGRNPGAQAAKILDRTSQADGGPPAGDMLNGQPVPDRVGRAVALRVAGQGGGPADQLASSAKDVIRQHLREEQIAAQTTRQAARAVRQQSRTEIANLRNQEGATLEATRQQGQAMVGRASQQAAGDPVADLLERSTNTPRTTFKQVESQAEAALQTTGERVFGPLKKHGTIEPSEQTAPVYDAIGNPLVREELNRRIGGSGERTVPGESVSLRRDSGIAPTFEELQRTYRMLGIRATQAARNGGELNGTMMREFFDARDELGAALEKVVPGFRDANRAYRADATVLEALAEGYSAKNAKAPDIRQRMGELHNAGGDAAVEAFQFGQRRALTDGLREQPRTADAATPLAVMGSDAEGRLATAFPTDRSFREFQSGVNDVAGALQRTRQTAAAAEQSVSAEFRARRDVVRQTASDMLSEITEMSKGRTKVTPQDRLRLAKEIESASRRLDVPTSGRPIKGAVELGAGARARGIIDVVFGLIGKKSDPERARQLLVDFLESGGSPDSPAAKTMRDAVAQKGNGLVGAATGATAAQPR